MPIILLKSVFLVALPVLVVGIGAISITGYFLGNHVLVQVGAATVASPLPIPFTDYRGRQESFTHTYRLHLMDSSVKEMIEVRSRDLVGPHKRKIPIISALSRPTSGYDEGVNATEQIFKNFFCEVMKTEPKLLYVGGYSRAFYTIESLDGTMAHSAIVVCGQG